ncbi:MAG: hypothetical protein HZA36_02080 [Parcubacteria group bacterium]|nr:hypothetical protein [Parcubacteria group bacterium]
MGRESGPNKSIEEEKRLRNIAVRLLEEIKNGVTRDPNDEDLIKKNPEIVRYMEEIVRQRRKEADQSRKTINENQERRQEGKAEELRRAEELLRRLRSNSGVPTSADKANMEGLERRLDRSKG